MKHVDFFKIEKQNLRKTIFLTVFVSLFLFAQWLGYYIEHASFNTFVFIAMALVMGAFGFIISSLLLAIPFEKTPHFLPDFSVKMKHPKATMFTILVLCWLPTLLAYYPGIWSYDVGTQINQILTNSISKYQPIVHTLLVKGVLELSSLLNSYELAIFIYSFLQLCVLAWSFAVFNDFLMKKFKCNHYLMVGIFLFQCLMPMNSIMAISSTKDTLFTALTIFVIVNVFQLLEDTQRKQVNWLHLLNFGAMVTLWISFRNNTIFVVIPVTILCLILYRQQLKNILICLMVSASLLFSFNFILDAVVKPQTYSSIEALSVPINQLSKSVLKDDLQLSSKAQASFDRIIGFNYRYYNPHLSDPVKSRLNFTVSDMGSFMSLWIEVLPKSFPNYVSAFLDLNRGSWYLFDESYARIYLDHYFDGELLENTKSNQQQGYLQTQLEQIIPIEYDSKLPFLYSYYEAIVSDNSFMQVGLLKILFSPALYVWLLLAAFLVSMYRRNQCFIVLTSIPLLYWLTTLLGPCTLVRYIYPVITLLPLMICILFGELKKEGITDES